MKAIKSANGLTGCLIYCGDDKYCIRVYDEHKLGMFEDYSIAISDLFFTITDEDAYLYEDSDGKKWIDHNPETLNLNAEDFRCPRCGIENPTTSCGIPDCGLTTGESV